MPGASFGDLIGSRGAPFRKGYPLAKSMNGTGTPPAATMKAGDIVCLSTASGLTTASAVVVRPLLAADKTANYENGSGVRCGILGICDCEIATDSAGLALAQTSSGGVISPTPGMGSMNPLHLSGQAQQTMIVFTPSTVFKMLLAAAAASAAAYAALPNTLAGITISTTSGVTTYTANTTDTGEQLMLEIVGIDPNDTTFKTVYLRVLGTGLTPTGSYMQYDTATPYTAQ